MLKWLFGNQKQEIINRRAAEEREKREAAAAVAYRRQAAAKLERESRIQEDLSNSLDGHFSVSIDYTNDDNIHSDRVIDVLGLGHGYADAYCHLRKEVRVFKIDRIDSTTLTEKQFYPPSEYVPTGWVSSGKEGRDVVDVNDELSGAELAGADLSDRDLAGTNFFSAILNNANLSGSDLTGTNLRYADLRGADLSNSDLTDVDLNGANLTGAKLVNAKLGDADFSDENADLTDFSKANLKGANLSGADLTGVNFYAADLTDSDLTGTDLSGNDLSGVNLTNANLADAYLRESELHSADLIDAIITRVDLNDAGLASANLTGADLTGSGLNGSDLSNANLTGANLTGAGLSRSDLSDANLTRANLTGADLHHAHLADANLSHANLADAVLSEADLRGANLTGAILTDACLDSAGLSGANLTGAKLVGATLDGAFVFDVIGIDLSGANLSSNDLTNVDLAGLNLSGACLNDVDLCEVDLGGSDLSGVDLTGAQLISADLTRTNLTGANLAGADLTDAKLRHANLTSANFTDASLANAKLFKADLTGATLTGADLTGAVRANLTGAILEEAKDPRNGDNTMPADHILDRPDDWTQTIWGYIGIRLADRLQYFFRTTRKRNEGLFSWDIVVNRARWGFFLGCGLSLHDMSLGKSILEKDCAATSPYPGEVSEGWESVYGPVIHDLHMRIASCGDVGVSYWNMFPESGPEMTQTSASKVIARQVFRGVILPFLSREVAEEILVNGFQEQRREDVRLVNRQRKLSSANKRRERRSIKKKSIPELLSEHRERAANVYKEWTELNKKSAELTGTESSGTNGVRIAQTPITNNRDFVSLYNQGTDFLDQDEFGKARTCFDEALLLKPDEPDTLFLRAVALEGLEDPELLDQALADCDAAIKIRPHYNNYLWVRARILLQLERYEESLADIDKAIQFNPTVSDGYSLDQFYFFATVAAMTLSVEDRGREGLEFLKRVIFCDPEKYRDLANEEMDFYLLSVDPQYGAQFRELVPDYSL